MKYYEVTTAGTAKPIEVTLPPQVSAQASGDYVMQEVHSRYPDLVIPVSTASTVVFAAREAEKEGLKLKAVKMGLNLGVFSLSFEWERNLPNKNNK